MTPEFCVLALVLAGASLIVGVQIHPFLSTLFTGDLALRAEKRFAWKSDDYAFAITWSGPVASALVWAFGQGHSIGSGFIDLCFYCLIVAAVVDRTYRVVDRRCVRWFRFP